MPEHFPALTQLEAEFNDHMREFRQGIETSEDLIYWLQRTGVLTLGCIEDEMLAKLFTDPYVPGAILLGQPAQKPRRDPTEEDLETETDAKVRAKIESHTFNPAFRRAYSDLKTHANEYVEEEVGSSEDSPPALRPSIEELSTRQRQVLDDLFQGGGFDSDPELSKWARDVVAATRGKVEDRYLRAMTMELKDPALYSSLRGEGPHNEATRLNFLQQFAAEILLPRFNAAIRDIAQTAGEQVDSETTSTTDTLGV